MFNKFRSLVNKQFKFMEDNCEFLLTTEAPPDDLWKVYLDSFPEGTNPIFRERTEHDCQCCKQFIRRCGNVVAVDGNNELISIWDIVGAPDHYQKVADSLSSFVKKHQISNFFINDSKILGAEHNVQLLESGETLKFEHFCHKLPSKHVRNKESIGGILSDAKSSYDVLKRGLEELTEESFELVLDLIDSNALYRGSEFRDSVYGFSMLKKEYLQLPSEHKERFCWRTSSKVKGLSRFRNSAIGTLLVDISEGVELDVAVRAFEAKVAPANYKRPTAVVTKKMVDDAQQTIVDLGLRSALQRRHATPEDITVNNVLFVDRTPTGAGDVFDEMRSDVPEDASKFKNIREVDIDRFISSALPEAETIEVLLENRFSSNLMSLVSPVDSDAKNMFKWNNNFSWAYNGDLADSIKARVKGAGGNVEGVLRCSLGWYNTDDLDIHVVEPNKNEIYYGVKGQRFNSSGMLDVDMNVSNYVRDAVENVTWSDKQRMLQGRYKVVVHNFTKRESIDVGFEVEIEYEGTTYTFHYEKPVKDGERVVVAEFNFTREGGIEFIKSLPKKEMTKHVWGLSTCRFHKVSTLMLSPNHWDGQTVGNKHWFFILEGCKNDQPVRGFFNEFLNEEFNKHRKVFEILGNKMKAPVSDAQLSGVGFSSTKRDHFICRVNNSQVFKVNI